MANSSISTSSRIELSRIAKRGAQIRSSLVLNTTALTPINLELETEKFFKSRTYNPRFRYLDPPPARFDLEIDNLEQRAEEINVPFDLMYHLIDYLNHLRFLYHARHSIGEPTFSVYAKLIYDWKIPDPDKLLKKLPEFKFENEEKGSLIKSKEIAKQLRQIVNEKYHLKNFPVKVNNFSSNIIFVSNKQVSIGRDIKRFQNNVDRLVVHEIESHALQYYNMRNSNNPFVALSKLSDSNLFAEGLGVYNEVKTDTITKNAFNNYYYRLKSVRNYNLGFRQIYEMLMDEKLSKKQAFAIAYRVKRGLHDTSRSGGYPKDAAYLLGYKAVIDFLKKNPENIMYCASNPNITKLLTKYGLLDKQNTIVPEFVNKK